MESNKPRAWEGYLYVGDGGAKPAERIPAGKILVECDRRDVLLRWTEDAEKATHYTETVEGEVRIWDMAGCTKIVPGPLYIATPVADLLMSEAQRAYIECRKTHPRGIVCGESDEDRERRMWIDGYNAAGKGT